VACYDEKRQPFGVKYRNFARRWGVDESEADSIIRRHTERFEEVCERLRRGERLQLPRYFRDARSDEEYMYDLVDGWIVEDLVLLWLRAKVREINPSVAIERAGANRTRQFEFRRARRITTEPDFRYTDKDGVERRIELQMAREVLECFDMKESKVKRALREGRTVFLWVLIPSDEYFFVDPAVFRDREPKPNPRWGGKLTYKMCLDEVRARQWGSFRMADPAPQILAKMLNI